MTNLRGVTNTGSILDRIVADKAQLVERWKREQPEASLRSRLNEFDVQWPLSKAIAMPRGKAAASAAVQIIAEVKKASPSKGMLAQHLDPVATASAYAAGGATGISVVTEQNYFQGDLDWLTQIRKRLSSDSPGGRPSLLRKDFIVESYEVLQARAYGADNILLIAAMLDPALMRDLLAEAQALELDALVEVHTEAEAEQAVQAGATLYGINNRDLHTFEVDLATTERVRPLLPADAIVVAESGVHTREDVLRLQRAGVRAILVGEAFMTAPNVPEKMAELRV